MNVTPFPVDPTLTGIAIAYRNARMIADAVLPRTPPVGTAKFKYLSYPFEAGVTIPDTRVGRKSEPKVMEFGATEVNDEVNDYGLDDIIPNDDVANAPQGHHPVEHAVQSLTDLVMLDREKRVADLVFNPASYPAENKIQLAGADQFSHVDSAPLEVCQVALDACLVRPNIGVFGQAPWAVFRRHPHVVKAVNRNDGDSGLAARRAVAELLELEEVLVGEGWLNTAKPGQAATLSRVWGKHIAFLHRSNLPDTQRVSFGVTVPFGTKVAGTIDEPKVGLRGSKRVRVGESLKEVIMASRAGYLIEDAVA